jgi:hypothetical protein
MPTKKSSTKKGKDATTPDGHQLADSLVVPFVNGIYAVPYYTRDGDDTEYLISNPNPSLVTVAVVVFGRDCRIVKKVEFKLKPNCTQSVHLRPIQPGVASFSLILAQGGELVVHLLYSRSGDLAIVAGELAGLDDLFNPRNEGTRTYAFGYRTQPYAADKTIGSVFVSNPNNTVITGQVLFFGQKCQLVNRKRFEINPGCTQGFDFPKDDFGYGLVEVSRQPVINVLHFAESAKGLTAAELVNEGNRVTGPVQPPKPKSRVLFDDTHGCRPGVSGDWTQYEAALVAAGYSVAHYTAPSVTLANLQQYDVFVIAIPRSNYTPTEKRIIVDYVNGGGGLLVVQDFGNAPWSLPTREILNLFGATDDNNFMEDPTHCFTPGQFDDVVFDYQRNFLPHPITNGWKSFHVDAATSLSGGAGWTTVVETDDDSTPPRRPAVLARPYGSGRVVGFGDSNTWADSLISHLENKTFGVRCIQWLLFVI